MDNIEDDIRALQLDSSEDTSNIVPNENGAEGEESVVGGNVKEAEDSNVVPNADGEKPEESVLTVTDDVDEGKEGVTAAAAPAPAPAPEVIEEVAEGNKKRHLNVVFIGHVDAGKSTIGGQILYLSGQVDERTIQKYEKEAKDKSRESWYMAYIMDTNEEERSKGITVEVGRAHFETETTRFTILDAPGHKSYVPNMISGASQADIGVLVISARKGEFETGYERGGQTREHVQLAKTLGVLKLLVVVNKMDDPTVNWSKDRYDEIESKMVPFLKSSGYNVKKDIQFLPISGLHGSNMQTRVEKSVCPWWNGQCLFEALDVIEGPLRDPKGPFRMPKVAQNPTKILSMFSLTKPPCVNGVVSISPHIFFRPPNHPLLVFTKPTQFTSLRSSVSACASLDEKNPVTIDQDEVQSTPNMEVEESVALLKKAAKTRNVPDTEILSALKLLEKAKLDPSQFCETLGGSESPGKTWMLVYTAQKGLKSGKFFPITAVQRFDAAARRIENGVYLGPLGSLTFEGRFSWKKRILAFVFELIRIKIGPFTPLEINIKGSDESEPTTKNPFFIWFYIDEEIAVARGRSGGTAFWCRCRRVNNF